MRGFYRWRLTRNGCTTLCPRLPSRPQVCGQSLHQEGIYCQPCAYSMGVCSMCGIKVLDISGYRMSEGSRLAEEAQQKKKLKGDGRGGAGWKLVKEKGYYVHLRSRFFWDPKAKLYFHKKIGRWTKELPVRMTESGAKPY